MEPLVGRHVRLEPLERRHIAGLIVAGGGDRSSFRFTTVPNGPDEAERYVDQLMATRAAGEVVPFAQCTPDGTALGCTRYMSLRRWRHRAAPDEVEIGGTWLTVEAQRTRVNTEAKYLLLRHAFDAWRVWRVEFVTDARNARSRAALERIGATFEGVLRNHRPAADPPTTPTRPRNSAVYSITDHDWPQVEQRLRVRLDT